LDYLLVENKGEVEGPAFLVLLPDQYPAVRRSCRLFTVFFVILLSAETTGKNGSKMSFHTDFQSLPCFVHTPLHLTTQSKLQKVCAFRVAVPKPVIQDGEETQSIAKRFSAS
jgi:hypothetical protein